MCLGDEVSRAKFFFLKKYMETVERNTVDLVMPYGSKKYKESNNSMVHWQAIPHTFCSILDIDF